MAIIGLRGYQT